MQFGTHILNDAQLCGTGLLHDGGGVMIIDYKLALDIVWSALEKYRSSIPEGTDAHDKEWNEICTAMAWIVEGLDEDYYNED